MEYSLRNFELNLSVYFNQILPKGKIVYEYNALRNFRITQNMYEHNYIYYTEQQLKQFWADEHGIKLNSQGDFDNTTDRDNFSSFKEGLTLLEPGAIIDLDTEQLGFNLNYPISIECQPSYDGTVNLILNDGKNPPRLINTRFSCRELNTYEIIDRVGNNDTNIYDQGEQFDLDTSLYKRINKIPKIRFNGTFNGGTLPVGNYTLYIKYADADNNETDFVAESGIISCFIGNYNDPHSVNGGYRDMNSNKYISITISNIDAAYDYIKVYYTRSTSDVNQNEVIVAQEILEKYPIINGICNFNITGIESTNEIPVTEINMQYFIASSVKAQAQCQNMLFQGNLFKSYINYTDLSDCALRILPYLKVNDSNSFIGDFNSSFIDTGEAKDYGYMYYNPKNIYERVGYYNHEIYRFGVVFIMKDGSLSPVFNTRGIDNLNEETTFFSFNFYNEQGEREYIKILDETTYSISQGPDTYENSKGVVRINDSDLEHNFPIYGIDFKIPIQVIQHLENNCNVKGLFFVRQKRIPLIIAQTYTMYKDQESNLPCIDCEGNVFIESFLEPSRVLNYDNYQFRKYSLEPRHYEKQRRIGLCPEYIIDQPHLNSLFQGTKYRLVPSDMQPNSLHSSNYNSRLYAPSSYAPRKSTYGEETEVAGVTEGSDLITIKEYNFSSKAGSAEEAYKFSYIGDKTESKDEYNYARGIYCSFLALGSNTLESGSMYNIYSPEYSLTTIEQFKSRYQDQSSYYSISDRISLEDIRYEWTYENIQYSSGDIDNENCYSNTCFRGDCFICYFTIRLNRNFQDPSAPNNDTIVDPNSWKDNFNPENVNSYEDINRGDINAVELGSWIMLKVLSPKNLSLRSLDYSYPDEEALTGHYRGFYPAFPVTAAGNYKTSESSAINSGYGSTTGDKQYYVLPDVPYIKNQYQTRIAYSQIAIGDAFQNGYRVFMQNTYRDYNTTYGGIMKLIELQGSLVCVFEHGTALIPVNERAVAGSGAGGEVFINTSNVLPQNPRMLSDMYGSQWPESVIKTPYYVYGVDTVGKKIWRTNGQQFEIISDFKVQKFLNNNITLSERELTPIIGIRNVKTHYNAFKQDVMFTFYDNLYGIEEKSWNLCYNEISQNFITFYSWIPSYSENIDNIFFSFDRNTSKWISRLAMSSANSSSAEGICVDDPRIDTWPQYENNPEQKFTTLSLQNRPLPDTNVSTGVTIDFVFSWVDEKQKENNVFPYNYFDIVNDKLVLIKPITEEIFETKDGKITDGTLGDPVIYLNIKCEPIIRVDVNSINYDNRIDFNAGWQDYISLNSGYYESPVALTLNSILNNPAIIETKLEDPDNQKVTVTETKRPLNLTTDFWKHGQSGIIDIKDKIKPTFWYGKQHPFEFEFIVVDDPSIHKIFNNLRIISNKAEPESFHYEIIGETYDFDWDKRNMYYRQEATKELYRNLGSDIIFDRNYTDILPYQQRISQNVFRKSTVFPLYYNRIDTINEIEDSYIQMSGKNRNYISLSGSEIVWDEQLNEFRIATHVKGCRLEDGGRLRGNMQYQEDQWLVQIPSITFMQKNESEWKDNKPDIVITGLPNDLKRTEVNKEDLPNTYDIGQVSTSGWTNRKETKIRDKYVKIKIRYTGKDLVIITAIKTLFTQSYA